MSALAFFPWLDLKRELTAGPIHLITYRRGALPGGDAQSIIDILTEPYLTTRRTSIQLATLFRFGDKGLFDPYDAAEIPEVFEHVALVTTAGLAARIFFSWNYWNRDHFRFTIQSFTEPDRGTFIQSRRLDGSDNIFVPHLNLVVAQPIQVTGHDVEIDHALLLALLDLRRQEEWPQFRESLHTFNLASTDDPEVPMETALVLMSGALEQLLGSESGKEGDFAASFAGALKPTNNLALADCSRTTGGDAARLSRAATVREIWVRDLFRLRGDLAHGRLSARYPSVWSVREHLLLASFIWPLVLKALLAARGMYVLTDSDSDGIDAFETLCCANHFAASGDNPADFPWHDALAHAGIHRLAEKWYKAMMPGAEGQEPATGDGA